MVPTGTPNQRLLVAKVGEVMTVARGEAGPVAISTWPLGRTATRCKVRRKNIAIMNEACSSHFGPGDGWSVLVVPRHTFEKTPKCRHLAPPGSDADHYHLMVAADTAATNVLGGAENLMAM